MAKKVKRLTIWDGGSNNQALQSADHLSPGLPFTHIDRHTDQSISVQVRKNETLNRFETCNRCSSLTGPH